MIPTIVTAKRLNDTMEKRASIINTVVYTIYLGKRALCGLLPGEHYASIMEHIRYLRSLVLLFADLNFVCCTNRRRSVLAPIGVIAREGVQEATAVAATEALAHL